MAKHVAKHVVVREYAQLTTDLVSLPSLDRAQISETACEWLCKLAEKFRSSGVSFGHRYLDGHGDMALIYPKWRQFEQPLAHPLVFSDTLRLYVLPFDLDSDSLLLPAGSKLGPQPAGSDPVLNSPAHVDEIDTFLRRVDFLRFFKHVSSICRCYRHFHAFGDAQLQQLVIAHSVLTQRPKPQYS